jgi:hypothetical protein
MPSLVSRRAVSSRWRSPKSSGRVIVEQVPGRHGDVLTSAGCRELASHFNAYLKRRPRVVA